LTARILDGRAISREVLEGLRARVAMLPRPPGLAVVLVGDDPASAIYVRNKARTAEALGFMHRQVLLPGDVREAEVVEVVRALNADPSVDGVLVQLPLPPHIRKKSVLDEIDPHKDVDGLHPLNAGLLLQKRRGLVACTPLGVMELLARTGVELAGREAVVIGRSNIVGRPMAALLNHADCTVTSCHRYTAELHAHVSRAEVLVAATGVPGLVRADWVKPGAIVIDVGIHRREDGTLCGDVEPAAAERAAWITPVPGGVGPMTIAMLMSNTVLAAERILAAPGATS
jgi:methylenetetrahydrofolate dehydrogenase (NADP+)/methenyltetrahydrofolate cyclohydrolase